MLTDERIVGMSFLMLIAGIDTTWSVLGAACGTWRPIPPTGGPWPVIQRSIPAAVEEFLRLYAPVTIGRVVTSRSTVGGPAIDPGRAGSPRRGGRPTRILEVFERPDTFVLAASATATWPSASAFTAASAPTSPRWRLRVSLEEWLAPDPGVRRWRATTVTWTGGNTRGPAVTSAADHPVRRPPARPSSGPGC